MAKNEEQKAIEEAERKSFVMIEFAGPGLAEFRILKHNVTPAQVLGAITVLELEVKNWYIQEENARRQQELSVPKPGILRP